MSLFARSASVSAPPASPFSEKQTDHIIESLHQQEIELHRSQVKLARDQAATFIRDLESIRRDLAEMKASSERQSAESETMNAKLFELHNRLSVSENQTASVNERLSKEKETRLAESTFIEERLSNIEQKVSNRVGLLEQRFSERPDSSILDFSKQRASVDQERLDSVERMVASLQSLLRRETEEEFKRIWDAIDNHTHEVATQVNSPISPVGAAVQKAPVPTWSSTTFQQPPPVLRQQSSPIMPVTIFPMKQAAAQTPAVSPVAAMATNAAFNSIDRNHDGVISRSEFSAALAAGPAASTSAARTVSPSGMRSSSSLRRA